MAAASNMAEFADLRHNGLGYLLDLIDRLPLREVTADVEQPDPLVLTFVEPSAPANADSSCAGVVGQLGGVAEQNDPAGRRKQ